MLGARVTAQLKCDSFNHFENEGNKLTRSNDYTETNFRSRRRNVRLNPLDYGRAEEANLSPSAKCKTTCFLPVIDQFLSSLDKRLDCYKVLSNCFIFFSNFLFMSENDIQIAAKRLVEAYPEDLDDSLIAVCSIYCHI